MNPLSALFLSLSSAWTRIRLSSVLVVVNFGIVIANLLYLLLIAGITGYGLYKFVIFIWHKFSKGQIAAIADVSEDFREEVSGDQTKKTEQIATEKEEVEAESEEPKEDVEPEADELCPNATKDEEVSTVTSYPMLREPVQFAFESDPSLNWYLGRWYSALCGAPGSSGQPPQQFTNRRTFEAPELTVTSTSETLVMVYALPGFEVMKKTSLRPIYDGLFSASYFSYQMLSRRVQAIFFNFEGTRYNAGIAIYLHDDAALGSYAESDTRIVESFIQSGEFVKLLSCLGYHIPRVLNFTETDLIAKYSVKCEHLNDQLIFAFNAISAKVEQFILNGEELRFERVKCPHCKFDAQLASEQEPRRKLLLQKESTAYGYKTMVAVWRSVESWLVKSVLVREKLEKPMYGRMYAQQWIDIRREEPIVEGVDVAAAVESESDSESESESESDSESESESDYEHAESESEMVEEARVLEQDEALNSETFDDFETVDLS
ncbi:unnamed protein product [Caenorhabditis sp. 36 PRJEB53466]|nr:unnamed protein product [Caenorhabditis sp. 36 PRJEB53466]